MAGGGGEGWRSFLLSSRESPCISPEMQSCHTCFHTEAPHGKGFACQWASAKQGHTLAKPFPGHKSIDGIFPFLVAALESEEAKFWLHRFLCEHLCAQFLHL